MCRRMSAVEAAVVVAEAEVAEAAVAVEAEGLMTRAADTGLLTA